jgi:hypothetical protein
VRWLYKHPGEGGAVPLETEKVVLSALRLHEVAVDGFTRSGRVLGTVGLLDCDAEIKGLLAFGPGGRPPSDAFIIEKAAAQRAAGLVLTGEYWMNPAPLTLQQVATLDPKDLPIPACLEPTQRTEQIVTTAVVRGRRTTIRIITPILRGAFGVRLGERRVAHDQAPMPTGEARRLQALLEHAAARGGEDR